MEELYKYTTIMATIILGIVGVATFIFLAAIIKTLIVNYFDVKDSCNHDWVLLFGDEEDETVAVECLKCNQVKEIKNENRW